jgi:hypothetical protein
VSWRVRVGLASKLAETKREVKMHLARGLLRSLDEGPLVAPSVFGTLHLTHCK